MRASRSPRYVVMSVRGDEDDGSDTWWFVLDRCTRRSTKVGSGDVALPIATARCRALNTAARKTRRC